MNRPLALVRPEPGWSASAEAARAAGLAVTGHPMFDIEPTAWDLPSGSFDALLIGSAAAFRAGGPQLAQLLRLPVLAVGEATAAAARGAGFEVAATGEESLQDLLDASAGQPAHFLRLCGKERVALNPHPGQTISECVVYRMAQRPVSAEFAGELRTLRPLIALHSAAAARHFAAETDRLEIDRGTLSVLALAPRVAEGAGLGWAALHIADKPYDAALLAKAAALCK